MPRLGLETLDGDRSVVWQSWNIQAASKCSGQSSRMRRLVWAFAGRTYHIARKLVSWLVWCIDYARSVSFLVNVC